MMRAPLQLRRSAAAAALAVSLAGCGSGGDAAAGDGGNGDEAASGTTVSVLGTDGLQFEPTDLSAQAGTVEVELTAESVGHTFVIEELDDTEVVAVDAGETATGSIDLEPGTYTFYCSVPGHRAGGMEGGLTVSS